MSTNGRLDPSELAPIAQGQLRRDAAAAWNSMNIEARALGVELLPTGSMSSYRTYAQQVYLYGEYRAGRGSLAAIPGASNHGAGIAVDAANQAMWSMIAQIGARYGWQKRWSDAPSEPWHHKWREGIWSGSDPGPYGSPAAATAPPAPPPQATYIYPTSGEFIVIAVMQNKDGRLEIFVERADGTVLHKWQEAPNKAFVANWASLGKP